MERDIMTLCLSFCLFKHHHKQEDPLFSLHFFTTKKNAIQINREPFLSTHTKTSLHCHDNQNDGCTLYS